MKKLMQLCCLALLFLPASLFAQFGQPMQQEEKPLAPVSGTYAIVNATIIPAPGKKIEQGTVVIKDGLIQAVGKNVTIPAEAIRIKGDSLFVYAGFIDGLSRAGVPKPKEETGPRPRDPGNPTPEQAGITPNADVRSVFSPGEKSVDDMRALGFTVAHVVPYGGMLPGMGAVVNLGGKNVDQAVLVPKAYLYSELTPAQRVYPNTVIGVIAKWRELYKQAVLSKNYESVYASNRSGLNRPANDRILESFYPVIDRKTTVMFEADRYLDIHRVFALQKETGFNLVLADIKDGADAINKIKAANTKVFLSLDLPEDKKEEKKDDKKDEKSNPEKEALLKRRAEAMARIVNQSKMFASAGVPFGYASFTAKTSDIKANLRRMIAGGLTEDQALAALTINGAQILGLADRLGTIDPGKMGNLVVTDKPYFNEKSNVRYVFVDGIMFKYDVKDTRKPDATLNITGTWTVVNADKSEDKITLRKEGNGFAGSMTTARQSDALPLENVTLNGNKLKYSYTIQAGGQSLKTDVEVTVEGDSFKGNATTGSASPTPVTGKKDPNK